MWWRISCWRQVAGTRQSTVSPSANCFKLSHCTIKNEFANPIEVWIFVPLRSVLSCNLILVLEIICPDNTDFFYANSERFFTIYMIAAINRPVCYKGVCMVCCTYNHGINVFLVDAFSPINIGFSIREFLCTKRKVFFIYIAQGYHIFRTNCAKVGFASSPGANQGNVKLIVGGVRTK